jgi:hypothetical protein
MSELLKGPSEQDEAFGFVRRREDSSRHSPGGFRFVQRDEIDD